MISVIILDGGEPKVTQLTFENLYKELKDIYGSELLIKDKWFELDDIKNRYVCFVEADCLVSKGYFKNQLEGLNSKGYARQIGIMSSATSVSYWDNKIYGYKTDIDLMGVMPNRKQKSFSPFTVQVAYIPGSIIRLSMLKTCLSGLDIKGLHNDLVYLSYELSMAFWNRSSGSQGKGYRIYLNPKNSYLTTENYVNDIGKFESSVVPEVFNLFSKESI